MQKIAVGKSITRAYGFLFGRIFQIIGIAWLPALIYAGGYYLLLQNLPAILPIDPHNGAKLVHAFEVYAFAGLAALLIQAALSISLTQEALGVRKDLALAHFVIGPRELRLSLALVRLYLIFIVGYVALIVMTVVAFRIVGRFMSATAVAAVKTAAATGDAAQAMATHASPTAVVFHGSPLIWYAMGVVAFVLFVAFILAMLRLVFLIAPVAAVEHHASLMQSWRLTRGSAWRIVLIGLCVFLPAAIAAGCAILFLAGDGLAAAFHGMMAVRPPNSKILIQFESEHAFIFACVAGVALVVMAALQAGATAAAYLTVTGHDEEESEDDDALVAPLLSPSHHDDGHGHDDHGTHDDHGHGGHEENGHGDDHGNGGHDENRHGGHEDRGDGHGHDDHGDGGHDDHGHGGGGDHGHGGHHEGEDGGHDDHDGHGHDDHGHGGGGHGHDSHGHDGDDSHSDHGHGGHHASHGDSEHAVAA